MTTATLSPELHALALSLREAEDRRAPIARPSAALPAFSVAEAYAVQQLNIAHRLTHGERVAGRKIGLTSLAMQEQLGVDSPDFGVITDAMVIGNDGSFDACELIAPRIEAEFAFRLSVDLAPGPSAAQLIAAIDGVAVALEIIDSRIAGWDIGLVDTIADNASSARIVCGAFAVATPELLGALPDTVISLHRDDEPIASGPGSAVLGDPLVSLQWLADALGELGDGFSAGDIVLAGAVAKAADLTPGSSWRASAPGLNPVTLRTIA